MLDSGSEIAVMDPSLVKQLDLRGKSDHLVLSTLSKSDEQHQGERISIAVESLIDDEPCRLVLYHVWLERDFLIPLRHQLVIKNKRRSPDLQGVPLPEVDRKKISMIISINIPEAFIPLEIRCGGTRDPIATRSCFGFSLLGCVEGEPK